jgi:hypothetical protein
MVFERQTPTFIHSGRFKKLFQTFVSICNISLFVLFWLIRKNQYYFMVKKITYWIKCTNRKYKKRKSFLFFTSIKSFMNIFFFPIKLIIII